MKVARIYLRVSDWYEVGFFTRAVGQMRTFALTPKSGGIIPIFRQG